MQTHYGAGPQFGHADWQAAQDRGMSNTDILRWVNSNINKLPTGPRARPGAGGLYDQIASAAGVEREERNAARNLAAQEKMMNSVTSSFNSRMDQVTQQMQQQQSAYESQIEEMTNSLMAYQNPQTRQSTLGVTGAGNKNRSRSAAQRRQGLAGSFGREGLRISSINI
tara:strand:+ start:256 stop:759 length:504 start_codon:yes stop_codon:yes gene_type:complete